MALTLAQLQDYINTNIKKNGRNAVTGDVMNYAMLESLSYGSAAYQSILVSGTNIKTINGVTLLGSGNIVIGSGITIGTTTITGGSDGRLLFQSGGVVQQSSKITFDGTLFSVSDTSRFTGSGTSGFTSIFSIFRGATEVFKVDQYGAKFTGGIYADSITASGTNALFIGNQSGSGKLLTISPALGTLAVGYSSATYNAALDIKAQGALSTDIALRVRNSGDSANLVESRGDGMFFINNPNFATVLWAQSSLDTFKVGTRMSYQRSVTSGNLEFLLQNGATGGKVKFASLGSTIYQLEDVFTGRHDTQNLALFTTTALNTNGTKVLNFATGTAPTAIAGGADFFSMYSADIVAGNAAPHFRTENGDIQKIYSIGGWGTPSGTLTRTTFDESTVTLAELAQRVAALITDLKTGHQLLKA